MINILITICARSGSQGVKNKNIKKFLGRPLIDYTLEIAEATRKIYKDKFNIDVAISSDSKEIVGHSKKYDKIIEINRSESLSSNLASKVAAIKDCVIKCEKIKNKEYQYVIDLDVTSPIRTVNDIYNMIELAIESKKDCIFSVTPSRRNPYFNMVEDINGKISLVKISSFIRRQDAPKVYDMNASIYCYNRKSFDTVFHNSPLDGECGIYEMKDTYCLDIDEPIDFEVMEIMYNLFSGKEN